MIAKVLLAAAMAAGGLGGATVFAARTETKEEPAAPAKTPLIVFVKGSATVLTGRDESPASARAGVRLVEKAELKTGPGAELHVQLDSARTLILSEGTRIAIPGIRWEGGEVPQVNLQDGRVRWTSKAEGVRLQTPIFDLTVPAGDFIFAYDAKTARAEVWTIEGEITFGATNAETSVKVAAGRKAWFQGVIEEGEVAADLLLQGRKIPRGKLNGPVALTATELKPYLEEAQTRAAESKRAAARSRQRKEADRKEGVICGEPRGRFNECAWTCDGNKAEAPHCRIGSPDVSCVRRRCNANGKWAEPKILDADEARARCKATAVVGRCDY